MLCVCKQYLFSSTVQLNELSDLIPDLEYADDMCLISDSMDELEEMLQDLDESCNEMGLTISTQKTKIMTKAQDQKQPPREVQLQLADEPVDVVEEFEYLRNIVMSNCELDREISVRIRKPSSSGACAGSCGTNRRLR